MFLNSDGKGITTGNSDGVVLWGMYTHIKEGIYNFTLNYEFIYSEKEDIGYFDIVLNGATETVASKNIKINTRKISIPNIEFKNVDNVFRI